MLTFARQPAGAPTHDPSLTPRDLAAPRGPLTLQDLVAAVSEFAENDAELVATVQHMISTGRVKFRR